MKNWKLRWGRDRKRAWGIGTAALILAFGGIVLMRAQGASGAPATLTAEAPVGTSGAVETRNTATRAEVRTPELHGFVALTQGAVLAHGERDVFAELRLEALSQAQANERAPISLAVVLDTSGSMAGQKILEARNAVARLVERMRDTDQLAIVTYDHQARVLQGLMPVSAVRNEMPSRIASIWAGGGTNIPAGLDLGAATLASSPSGYVRRLVLISDGLDGSGRPQPMVIDQVRARAGQGVTTSSLGVGVDYDERYLTGVADAGSGNYEFLANADQLQSFLGREVDQAAGTVADQVMARLRLPAGWRFTRAYGVEASATNGEVLLPLGALYGGQRRRVTLQLHVAAGAPGDLGAMQVNLGYRAVASAQHHALELGGLRLMAVADPAAVTASQDTALYADAVSNEIDSRQAAAIEAWRAGQAEQAVQLSRANLVRLQQLQVAAPSAARGAQILELNNDIDNFGNNSADSTEGRAYGLGGNARRRARSAAY